MNMPSRAERKKFPIDLKPRQIASYLMVLMFLAAPVGCAQSNEKMSTGMSERLAEAPIWLTDGCRSHWKTPKARRTVVCGVGSAGPNRNRVADRETAIARARSAIARSIEVTIESLVRVEDSGTGDGELREFVHQLTSESLPSCQLESVWRSRTGEIHALVSLQVARVERSVRNTRGLSAADREDLARRATGAFAELDSTPRSPSEMRRSESGGSQ